MIDTGLTVALVDDCALTRYLCRRGLEQQGVTVLYEAGNGQDFIHQLQQKGIVPDGCLLDIDMPVMDGYETTRLLSLCFPDITILAYSASVDPGVTNRIQQAGAHGFVEKGHHPATYGTALLRLCNRMPQTLLRSPPMITEASATNAVL